MNANLEDRILASLARLLDENRDDLLGTNRSDIENCPQDDAVIVDRLKIDQRKIDGMIASVQKVQDLADPGGHVLSSYTRKDGLRIENRRVPFGTVLIIFEARPDVCVEAAAIALKGGNRILLKGGKEARGSNLFLADLWRRALIENNADASLVGYLDISREETQRLIVGETEKFDLVIPRGGCALIDFVLKNSKAPVLVSGRGNNFLYVDKNADLDMAVRIAVDGKSRLSVCNALDKIFIHKDLLSKAQSLADPLRAAGIEIFGDTAVSSVDPKMHLIEDETIWYEEFLAARIAIGMVDSLDDAIAKINKYSGGHSASIVTSDTLAAERFLAEVDCAAVYHNASVRFTDGGEFGLGAEIAISTQKLHFRGPLGAEHLMTNKWFVYGDGQVRR
ncbi:MAG TPA: glutamate-5-semialdehyde dehydrogenase [Pyrinomonadaceae bacterium]|nr:glutamate-5-semialdehyde dehydrogenase [Pyrinomonadaceae bacterium]